MSVLADVFAEVRLNLNTGEFEAKALRTADSVGASMQQRLFGSFEKNGGLKGLVIGAGVQLVQSGMQALGNVIGDVTTFLQDSVVAYRNEEAAQGRLTASLQANIKGWNGNTTAIEQATRAGMALGFTDSDIANSLSLLVAATHDQAKALEVLSVAEDLARFKNISVSDAAAALTSIEAGRARGLAALGINVKDYSTIEERLMAVEKLATGQAQTYAKTGLGAIAIAAAQAEKAQERLGKALAPVETEWKRITSGFLLSITGTQRDIFQNLEKETADMLAKGGASADELAAHLADLQQTQDLFVKHPLFFTSQNEIDSLNRSLATTKQMMQDAATAAGFPTFGKWVDDLTLAKGAADGTSGSVGDVGGAAAKALSPLELLKKSLQDSASASSDLNAQLSGLSDAQYGVAATRGELAKAQKDYGDLVKAGPKSQDLGDLRIFEGLLADGNKRVQDLQGTLALAEGPQAFSTWMQTLGASLDLTNPKIKAIYDLIVKTGTASKNLPFLGGGTPVVKPGMAPRAFAVGTPYVEQDQFALIHRGEAILPADVNPWNPTSNVAAAPTGGNTYQVNVQGLVQARDPFEIVTQLQRLGEFGVLSPRAALAR